MRATLLRIIETDILGFKFVVSHPANIGQSRSIHILVNTKYLFHMYTRRSNVFDVVPTLYKCCTNVLCLLGLQYDYTWHYIGESGSYYSAYR